MWGDDDGNKAGLVEVEKKKQARICFLLNSSLWEKGKGGFDLEFGFGEDDMKERESSGES